MPEATQFTNARLYVRQDRDTAGFPAVEVQMEDANTGDLVSGKFSPQTVLAIVQELVGTAMDVQTARSVEEHAADVAEAGKDRMDPGFAVFNGHVNDASDRADAEYVAQFGQASFDEHIKPLHDAGIMSVFNTRPTAQTMAWTSLVTAYVNENRK
jgi:hypothetical protein